MTPQKKKEFAEKITKLEWCDIASQIMDLELEIYDLKDLAVNGELNECYKVLEMLESEKDKRVVEQGYYDTSKHLASLGEPSLDI